MAPLATGSARVWGRVAGSVVVVVVGAVVLVVVVELVGERVDEAAIPAGEPAVLQAARAAPARMVASAPATRARPGCRRGTKSLITAVHATGQGCGGRDARPRAGP
jgi:hypothetical protein